MAVPADDLLPALQSQYIYIYIFFYISPFANLIKSDLIFQYRPFVQYSQVTSVSGEKRTRLRQPGRPNFCGAFGLVMDDHGVA
jgi:hypothetical protein